MRVSIAIVAFFLGLSSVPGRADPAAPHLYNEDLWAFTPVEFLDYLKTTKPPAWGVYTIVEPLKGWVRKEHIPALIALLDSQQRCIPVVHAKSSFLPDTSTVGREAATMITGYRDGEYPSALHAEHTRVKRKEELRAWWEQESLR